MRLMTALLIAGLAWPLAGVAAEKIDPAKIELGKKIYDREKCAACHSIEGKGNRRRPLDGVGSRLDEATIRKWIVAPRELSPRARKLAYDLPEDELEALVAYMMSLKEK